MNGRKFLYFGLCVALALLPLAGCSSGGSSGGGSVGSVSTGEKGVSLTVEGTVDGKTAGKSLAKTAIALNAVEVYNAQDGAALGSATIAANGSFSNLTFTLPSTKTILVFKATVAQGTFLSIVPIDLSTPPAAGVITGGNPITIVISQESTATAQMVSSLLGLAGDLGDAGMTLNSLNPQGTYAATAQLVIDNGGQQLAYSGSGLAMTGKFTSAALLPAQDANTLTGDELLNMTLDGKITGVSIPGNNPIVSFQVTNAVTGKGIRGLKSFGLAIAQLKPEDATTKAPSEWLSYMLTPSSTTPTVPARPSTDSGYTVIDNGDGSYTAKFGKDIKNVTNAGAGVTYNASLTHRVAVQVRTAPFAALTTTGTSVTNFRNEKIIFYDFVPATPTVAPTAQRNIVKTEACAACHTKLGVTTPHGGRGDVRYCMMCHNAQRANGQTTSTSTAGAFTGTTYVADGEVLGDMVPMIHKIHMGEELTKKGYNYAEVFFNEVLYPMPIKNCTSCHIEDTVTAPQALNWKDKPSRKACGACHDNITWATGANSKPGGIVHFASANDSACGTCHASGSPVYAGKIHVPVAPPNPDNRVVNATPIAGTDINLPDNGNTNASYLAAAGKVPPGATKVTYVISSVSRNASKQPVIAFKFQKQGPADAAPVDVVFNTYAAGTVTEMIDNFVGSPSVYFFWGVPQDGIAAPADYNASVSAYLKNIWRNDNKDMTGAALSGTSTAKGTMTGPVSGYYTITMTNCIVPDSARMLTGAIGYTYSLTSAPPLVQTNLPEYPYTPVAVVPTALQKDAGTGVVSVKTSVPGGTGGLSVPAPNVWKVADTYTGRRVIVSNAKCNACHGALGVAPTYHSGQRNDAPTCTVCHTVNRTNSGWPVNINYDVHGIHAAGFRTNMFSWEATAGAKYWNVAYPAILNNCEACHITGMYDFSANVNPGHGAPVIYTYTPELMSNLLMTTAASGAIKKVGDAASTTAGDTRTIASVKAATTGTETFDALNLAISPFINAGTTYGKAFSYNANSGVTTLPDSDVGTTDSTTNPLDPRTIVSSLVLSPISAACSGCHDSAAAAAHMKANGGTVFGPRTTALANTEQCLICHGPGKMADIKAAHAWK